MIIMPLLLNHWFIYGDVVVFCGEFLKYTIYVRRSDVSTCNVYSNKFLGICTIAPSIVIIRYWD